MVVENFGLHPPTKKKTGKRTSKKTFSKIRFHSGELSVKSGYRRIPGYMFMESQDESIVMSSVVEKFQQT